MGLLLAVRQALQSAHPSAADAVGETQHTGNSSSLPTPAPGAKSAPRAAVSTSTRREELIAALRSPDVHRNDLALETLLPDLIRQDIAAAADLAASLEAWASREKALLKVANAWAETDPQAAYEWSKTLPYGEGGRYCFEAICHKAALTDPALAVSFAEHPPGKPNWEFQASLAGLWVAKDPQAAEEWISRQIPILRDMTWAIGVTEIAKRSPEEAANLAVEKISPGNQQNEAVISALHQWVLQDRKAAAEWVDLFQEGALRTRAEGELQGTH
ncbi:hypothetical protein [Haloferula sp. BvORR071]|uniref:hypothetical protein n=1 Tax=Haloferula sp. BvORR071 TaxID=1396141 RepID=UPI002240EE9E|nr:hypothetical protein [Haloferula sp. BvORR071]